MEKNVTEKNPVHFNDYCHPGDETYDELMKEDLSDEDDDRPDCQYGTACLRTNTQHRLQYRHTVSPRPMKTTAKTGKKSVLEKEADDDGGPNTYDYKDSFLDDRDISGSEESCPDPEEEDSDYVPEDSQDVRDLVKEAKAFKKNKKMVKPAKSKT